MRWALVDRKEEKWFVRTARIFAWLLVIPYAILWACRLAYVIEDAAAIYYALEKRGLFQALSEEWLYLVFLAVPDLVIGIPILCLFGLVRRHTQERRPNQSPQPMPLTRHG